MKLICMECGKQFESRGKEPACPKCGSHDVEPNYQEYFPVATIHKARVEALVRR